MCLRTLHYLLNPTSINKIRQINFSLLESFDSSNLRILCAFTLNQAGSRSCSTLVLTCDKERVLASTLFQIKLQQHLSRCVECSLYSYWSRTEAWCSLSRCPRDVFTGERNTFCTFIQQIKVLFTREQFTSIVFWTNEYVYSMYRHVGPALPEHLTT